MHQNFFLQWYLTVENFHYKVFMHVTVCYGVYCNNECNDWNRLSFRKLKKAMNCQPKRILLLSTCRKQVSYRTELFLDLVLESLLEVLYWLADGFSQWPWQLLFLSVHVSILSWLGVVESLQEWRLLLDMYLEFARLSVLWCPYLPCKIYEMPLILILENLKWNNQCSTSVLWVWMFPSIITPIRWNVRVGSSCLAWTLLSHFLPSKWGKEMSENTC